MDIIGVLNCVMRFCFSEEELFEYLEKLGSNLVIIGNGIEFIYEKLKNKYNVISNMDSFGEVLTGLVV